MLCILRYSCFVCLFVLLLLLLSFVFLFCFCFVLGFFIQNVVDLTISPIKKELDLHVGSDGGLKKDCKVIFVVVVVVVIVVVVAVVHMYGLPVHLLSFISYFIYILKVTRVRC